MVERLLIVRWVVGSIVHGRPTELLLVPASGIVHIKDTLLLHGNSSLSHVVAAGISYSKRSFIFISQHGTKSKTNYDSVY